VEDAVIQDISTYHIDVVNRWTFGASGGTVEQSQLPLAVGSSSSCDVFGGNAHVNFVVVEDAEVSPVATTSSRFH
jgi:hypothetical protein